MQDTILVGFSTAKQAASAAAQLMQAVTAHDWHRYLKVEVSIGVHSRGGGDRLVGACVAALRGALRRSRGRADLPLPHYG